MAKCPACNYDVRTPFFLNLDAWTHLKCARCNARLEMKPSRSALFAPVMAPLFVLARQRRVLEVIAFLYMFVTFSLLLFEGLRPKVQLRRKPVPKPDIRLNINGPVN